MDNLNNIPSVGNWGEAASKLNDNFNKVKQAITTVENASKNNKGYFSSLSALNTAFPSPKAGQTAYVYGEASSTKYYIYNAVNGAWVASSVEAPAVEVNIAEYTKSGGSSKTTKEIDDNLIAVSNDVASVGTSVDAINSRLENDLSFNVYDGVNTNSLIGGWVDGVRLPTNASYIRENINGYLELEIQGVGEPPQIAYASSKKIDFTNISRIHVELEVVGTPNVNARARLQIADTQDRVHGSSYATTILFIDGSTPRQVVTANVTNRTGLHYLLINAASNTPSGKVNLKIHNISFETRIASDMYVENHVSQVKSDIETQIATVRQEIESSSTLAIYAGATDIPQGKELTGGWRGGYLTPEYESYIREDVNGYIELKVVAPVVAEINYTTTKKIDITNVKYIDVDVESLGISTVDALRFRVLLARANNLPWSNGETVLFKTGKFERGIVRIDVSDKTGLHHIQLSAAKTTTSIHTIPHVKIYGVALIYKSNSYVFDEGLLKVVSRNQDVRLEVESAIYGRFNFMHITDLHGDVIRTRNAINYLNSIDNLSFGVVTGDLMASYYTNSKAVITEMASSGKPILPVLGNHDVGNSFDINKCGDHTQVYNSFIKPFVDNGWLSTNENYWYKDFDDHKIRMIGLYEYDEPLDIDPNDNTKYRLFRGRRVYSQTQIDWLINLLHSTPQDYHLVMVTHQNQQENNEGTINTLWNADLTTIGQAQNYIIGDLVPDLINAWQNGEAIAQTYYFNGEAQYLNPLIVVTDFSARGEGAFVGYFYGHSHRDIIGKSGKYPTQNVFALAELYLSAESVIKDGLVRLENTKSEDVINIVSVDTDKKEVYIVRVGANYTRGLKERKTLVVNY